MGTPKLQPCLRPLRRFIQPNPSPEKTKPSGTDAGGLSSGKKEEREKKGTRLQLAEW
jgi:hypothetical protein